MNLRYYPIWLCAVVALVSLSLAGPARAELYAGFQTGVDRADIKTTGAGKDDRGFEGGGLLGYEFFFGDGWFGGVEGFFNLRSFKQGNSKSLYRLGLSAIAGRQVMPLVDVFAFIGPQWEQWEVSAREATTGSGADTVQVNDEKFDDTILGFHLGVGVRYVVSPSWQVRAQYRYARAEDDYGRITRTGSGNNRASAQSKVDIVANSHVVSFGFTYTF